MTVAMQEEIESFSAVRPAMNIVIVGHVDHGKSTLVGRLFYDTNSLPDGRYEAVARVCEASGKPFEYAFLLDALEEERDQGITIDAAQARFHTATRDYVLIDAPGHKEFLKNMISGAASAEAAILLIDAAEGVQEQSRRHGFLLHLLGIRQVIVAINKMDLVDYSQAVFEAVRGEYLKFLGELGVHPQAVIPICARDGDNLARRGDRMAWHGGPTILEALDEFVKAPSKHDQPLRLPVQDVYKFDARRIIAGRVESGTLAVGDEILFSPSGRRAVVKTLERWQSARSGPARAGESIGLTLTEQIFVERGEIVSHAREAPRTGSQIQAHLFWLGDRHLSGGRHYMLKLGTQEIPCEVAAIQEVLNTASLEASRVAQEVAKNEVARLTLTLKKPVAFDCFTRIEETGRFVLVDGFDVTGGGIIQAGVESSFEI